MREDFLHYVWRSKQLQHVEFKTVQGDTVRIEDPGSFNKNQGPDFLYARIYINDTLWVGHLEMHLKSSDWHKHNHGADAQYRNCILHVVWEHDTPVGMNNHELPCVELKQWVDVSLLERYQSLQNQLDDIPCCRLVKNVPGVIISNQLYRSMFERLEQKTEKLRRKLLELRGDWEALIAYQILTYLLAPVNQKPAEQLIQNLSWKTIIKIRENLHTLESYLFGVASFLNKPSEDTYVQSLGREFGYLKKKFKISEMAMVEWKYSRLRPAHFPEIRLAQWASFLHHRPYFFSQILECSSGKQIKKLLEIPLEGYWKHHYTLRDAHHKNEIKHTGHLTVDVLIINAVVPILFANGYEQSDLKRQQWALQLLEEIKAERNQYTRYWEQKMVACRNASQSQALIHQMSNYCIYRRCLECQIGHYILTNTPA